MDLPSSTNGRMSEEARLKLIRSTTRTPKFQMMANKVVGGQQNGGGSPRPGEQMPPPVLPGEGWLAQKLRREQQAKEEAQMDTI